jgi:hypothetical protein
VVPPGVLGVKLRVGEMESKTGGGSESLEASWRSEGAELPRSNCRSASS